MTSAEELKARSRKTLTFEDGTEAVIRRINAADFVKAGLPAAVFDVGSPMAKRSAAAEEFLVDLASGEMDRRVDFQNRVMAAGVIAPRLWPEGLPGDEPEGYAHVDDFASNADEAFLEILAFAGVLQEEAAREALRTFRGVAGGGAGGEAVEDVRSPAEPATD